MLKSRNEVLSDIRQSRYLTSIFQSWTPKQQESFLCLCTGIHGVKILYDGFFKEIFNPEYAPERLSDLLSLLLHEKVNIINVLPNDSTRLGDESSLLVTDIIVEFEDGTLANVEIQKIGYYFPGQRCACYSSDLLLRQYKHVKDQANDNNKKFSYRDIKTVYTIVFYEKSPEEFHSFQEDYIHYFQQKSDTGLELDLLQKYVMIPLDIFKITHQNKPIENKLQAWLRFLSTDVPEEVLALIRLYPEFKVLYEEIYTLCQNTEKVMEMFSKELLKLDRNTVQYMIDDMQDTIDAQNSIIAEKDSALAEKESALAENKNTITELTKKIQELEKQLNSTTIP